MEKLKLGDKTFIKFINALNGNKEAVIDINCIDGWDHYEDNPKYNKPEGTRIYTTKTSGMGGGIYHCKCSVNDFTKFIFDK